MRGASRGLAAVDAARGTLVAYATAPGSVAADGDGANGLYTEELLQALRVPNLKVEELFKRVRIAVTERSKGAQTPWESSSLTGDLVVNVTVNVTTPAAPAGARARSRVALLDVDQGRQRSRRPSRPISSSIPNGAFAPLARQRLASATAAGPRRLDAARFDGTWKVTVECPPHQSAAGYTQRFSAEVKDGVLTGQFGTHRAAELADAQRQDRSPDGKASIDARGVTGDPKFTVEPLEPGLRPTPYRADVQFDGARGSGSEDPDPPLHA